MASAIANELPAEASFFNLSTSTFRTALLDNSIKSMEILFQIFEANKPCVLFYDDFDTLGGEENLTMRIKGQFLDIMRADYAGIQIIGATRAPWLMDRWFRSKIGQNLHFALPGFHDRAKLIRHLVQDRSSITFKECEELALMTSHFSPSDLQQCVKISINLNLSRALKAQYFRLGRNGLYMACSESTPGAKNITAREIPKDNLCPPAILFGDLHGTISNFKRTVNHNDHFKMRHYNPTQKSLDFF